ncbi:MAG TPA: UDP-N-acetylmuramoyl-L-alanyl-D-glutamate--2,6-diaminopimelate ligase [Bacteroidota bacterium]|nr:UDP-N-acetylmuramoyl-L-alanyl-D-glutamate--2,6-diaminopimelate ligase [Bacteroidota bacterium]
MNLNELLAGVPVSKMFQTVFGKMASTHDVMVSGIQYDSRKVQRGGMFVALRGGVADGHKFIGDAIQKGVKVVVTEDDANPPDSLCMHTGTVKLVVDDSRRTLALLSANFFGRPADRLKIIGVTGTNGKTTTVHLIKQMLESNPAFKVGSIGTIDYRIGHEEVIPSTHTTPESLELHSLFSRMVQAGCTHAVMEVSSHSLAQQRVHGIRFRAAVFTNLTQDHLDYHGTMDQYLEAKKILFDELPPDAAAIVNADSPYTERITASTRARIVRYGIGPSYGAFGALHVALTREGFTAEIDGQQIETRLSGLFNVQNFCAAYAAVKCVEPACALTPDVIAKLEPASGRFEQFHSQKGWTVIVDYAHTPDAITNCLQAIRDSIVPQAGADASVTIVFGAGGDRDTKKRPLMGRAAEELSDRVIVTSDNPRTEDPRAIIDQVLAGMAHPERATIEPDRRKAIELALTRARKGEIILLAGKGHEDYQVIGTEKIHLSDKELVRQLL